MSASFLRRAHEEPPNGGERQGGRCSGEQRLAVEGDTSDRRAAPSALIYRVFGFTEKYQGDKFLCFNHAHVLNLSLKYKIRSSD